MKNMKRIKVSVYEDNGWTKIGENSGLVLMIIDTYRFFLFLCSQLSPKEYLTLQFFP
jgi:hypothetical protein